MARHLHVEGMDLSGKTSFIARYVEKSNTEWQVRHGLLNEDNPIRSLADQLAANKRYSQQITNDLYIAGIAADIETYRAPIINTIQDSVVALRALAWHISNNNRQDAARIETLLERHPQFDNTFYFAADIRRRQERLIMREREDPARIDSKDLLVREDPERFIKMERIVQKYTLELFNAHLVDTSDLTPTEVLRHVETIENASAQSSHDHSGS